MLRTAHAFNASFAFSIKAEFDVPTVLASDTSAAFNSMPVQLYDQVEDFTLPLGCRLIGIEITEDAVDLPSFTHPAAAAYVLGAEQDSLSPALQARCDFIVKIPQVGGDAALDRVEARGKRIGDGHVMGGEREHLRDAVTHQAGTNDRDAGSRHAQPAV